MKPGSNLERFVENGAKVFYADGVAPLVGKIAKVAAILSLAGGVLMTVDAPQAKADGTTGVLTGLAGGLIGGVVLGKVIQGVQQQRHQSDTVTMRPVPAPGPVDWKPVPQPRTVFDGAPGPQGGYGMAQPAPQQTYAMVPPAAPGAGNRATTNAPSQKLVGYVYYPEKAGRGLFTPDPDPIVVYYQSAPQQHHFKGGKLMKGSPLKPKKSAAHTPDADAYVGPKM